MGLPSMEGSGLMAYLMPAFFALGVAHGPVKKNGALPPSKMPSALVSSTLVVRTLALPSLAISLAPLSDPALLTITLLGS